jgi:hypothetical protein
MPLPVGSRNRLEVRFRSCLSMPKAEGLYFIVWKPALLLHQLKQEPLRNRLFP